MIDVNNLMHLLQKRRRYRFSIKQLILEYNNHIQRGLRDRVQNIPSISNNKNR